MEEPILLPSSDKPRVSIVIVTARQPQLLVRCLSSLARHETAVPFEVVVVLNAALPEVVALVREGVEGVTVVASSVPLGLAGGANRGRAVARGELLVLLHDDTEVQPGWLDGLVATADAHPEAGAVGSRILHLDGTPQSMGSVLWRDGQVWVIGGGPESLVLASDTTIAVDYCGSSSLLIRAKTWDAIQGADERFYPAVFVDVDLCLGVWTLGQAVLCTPASRVRHHRSASTGRLFQVFLYQRHLERFHQKWRQELEAFEPPAPGSVEGLQRALARAQMRWEALRTAASSGAAPIPPARSRPPFDPSAQERRVLEIALDTQRAWSNRLSGGPEHALVEQALAAAAEREQSTAAALAVAAAAADRERSRADALDRALASAQQLHDEAQERERAELTWLRERNAMLTAIEHGRWWRLHERLLPLLRLVRRFSDRATASRTE
jgi:GT2 family glycosyltransferase